MGVVPTSPHNSDGSSDISNPLLLAPIVAMDALTSEACCYYGGTWHMHIATSPHNSDGSSNISITLLLVLTVVTSVLTSGACRYWSSHNSDGRSNISHPSLLDCAVGMG
jgi:hypothetical protein